MPAMGRLIESGRLHRLKASLPEISAVSWTDFMTGADSGTHGVFGFTDLKPSSYEPHVPEFLRYPDGDFLGRARPPGQAHDHHQPALDVSRPAPERRARLRVRGRRPRQGRVPGFLPRVRSSPWATRSTSIPCGPAVGPRFSLAGPGPHAHGSPPGARSSLAGGLGLFRAGGHGTDRLHHFLWSAGENAEHPGHGRFLDYYRRVDELIGQAAGAFRDLAGSDDGAFPPLGPWVLRHRPGGLPQRLARERGVPGASAPPGPRAWRT